MILMQASSEPQPLVYTGSLQWGLIAFTFELRFTAALPSGNAYTLEVGAAWPVMGESENARCRKSAESWFDLWTSDFHATESIQAGAGSPTRYAEIARLSRTAEIHLSGVPQIQQAIVLAMRNGATFSTAHKEGGTEIRFERGQFLRSDYGDNPAGQRFANEAEFLAFLRKFYDWETSRNTAPNKVSDYVAWKLILRLLDPRSRSAAPAPVGFLARLFGRR